MTAPKSERLDLSRDELLEIAHQRFSGDGWQYLQHRFDELNRLFFDGILPSVLILTARSSSGAEAGRYYGRAIFVSKTDRFNQELILLHEMSHLFNLLHDIYDADHGLGWVDSLEHIYEKLNIRIETKDFTEEEALSWPFDLFKNYGVFDHFKRSFDLYGELRPLPSIWQLKKSVSPERDQKIEVICTGNILEDLEALEQAFGVEYIEILKGNMNDL